MGTVAATWRCTRRASCSGSFLRSSPRRPRSNPCRSLWRKLSTSATSARAQPALHARPACRQCARVAGNTCRRVTRLACAETKRSSVARTPTDPACHRAAPFRAGVHAVSQCAAVALRWRSSVRYVAPPLPWHMPSPGWRNTESACRSYVDSSVAVCPSHWQRLLCDADPWPAMTHARGSLLTTRALLRNMTGGLFC